MPTLHFVLIKDFLKLSLFNDERTCSTKQEERLNKGQFFLRKDANVLYYKDFK